MSKLTVRLTGEEVIDVDKQVGGLKGSDAVDQTLWRFSCRLLLHAGTSNRAPGK